VLSADNAVTALSGLPTLDAKHVLTQVNVAESANSAWQVRTAMIASQTMAHLLVLLCYAWLQQLLFCVERRGKHEEPLCFWCERWLTYAAFAQQYLQSTSKDIDGLGPVQQ